MMDIHCEKCGEPWTEYALRHDVPDWEGEPEDSHERFMSGEGCPTCDWGRGEAARHGGDSRMDTVRHYQDIMRNSDTDPARWF